MDSALQNPCGITQSLAAAALRPAPGPDHTIDMVFEKVPSGAGQFNLWQVNGKAYPHDREFVLQQGARHRLVFRNRTDDSTSRCICTAIFSNWST